MAKYVTWTSIFGSKQKLAYGEAVKRAEQYAKGITTKRYEDALKDVNKRRLNGALKGKRWN